MGENIFKFRKDKKLSQEQLAEMVGVSRQTISNWELNETVPDANQLLALSKSLGVSVDKLLNNEIIEEVNGKINNENQGKTNGEKNYIALEKMRIENKIKMFTLGVVMWSILCGYY